MRILNGAWLAALCLWSSLSSVAAEEKIKVEELLAKHRASVGAAEALAAYQTAAVQGTGHLRMLRGGTGSLEGRVVMISDGLKSRFSVDFGHLLYSGEQFICDGNNVEIQYVRNETRSHSDLGMFFYRYPQLIKNGLWGGSLTRAWALLNHDPKELRLRYRGLSGREGRQLYEASIDCKGCGEVEIHLFFEEDTFRHVLTTYSLVTPVPPTEGRSLNKPMKDPPFVRYSMEEHFSNFRTQSGITQPTEWLVRYSRDQQDRTILLELNSRFEIQLINNPFEPALFEARP
ncbi:MAG: hypothetical protein ACE15E_10185 [Acidobacteriota bacterium]